MKDSETNKFNDKDLIRLAAESLARIFIQQIKSKENISINKQIENKNGNTNK